MKDSYICIKNDLEKIINEIISWKDECIIYLINNVSFIYLVFR